MTTDTTPETGQASLSDKSLITLFRLTRGVFLRDWFNDREPTPEKTSLAKAVAAMALQGPDQLVTMGAADGRFTMHRYEIEETIGIMGALAGFDPPGPNTEPI